MVKRATRKASTIGMDARIWNEISSSSDFKALIRAKLKAIVPATVFFILYYFALPILVGYAPKLMARKVIGGVNIAYLFALSQFVVAWGIAAWYLSAAARFDAMAKRIVEQHVAPNEIRAGKQ